jgi:hypothetical protein
MAGRWSFSWVVAIALVAACGGGEDDVENRPILIGPPTPREGSLPFPGAHFHEKNPILPRPSLEIVEKGAAKVAAWIEKMAPYGFFAACDTHENRLAFAREKLWKLPPMAVHDLLARDLNDGGPSLRVALLEMDPANLLTLEAGAEPGKLLVDMAVLTRGALAPPQVSLTDQGRLSFHHGEEMLEIPCHSIRALVEGLNAHSERWGGEFLLFEAEGTPIGVAFFKAEHLQAVRRDGFDPYK